MLVEEMCPLVQERDCILPCAAIDQELTESVISTQILVVRYRYDIEASRVRKPLPTLFELGVRVRELSDSIRVREADAGLFQRALNKRLDRIGVSGYLVAARESPDVPYKGILRVLIAEYLLCIRPL